MWSRDIVIVRKHGGWVGKERLENEDDSYQTHSCNNCVPTKSGECFPRYFPHFYTVLPDSIQVPGKYYTLRLSQYKAFLTKTFVYFKKVCFISIMENENQEFH